MNAQMEGATTATTAQSTEVTSTATPEEQHYHTLVYHTREQGSRLCSCRLLRSAQRIQSGTFAKPIHTSKCTSLPTAAQVITNFSVIAKHLK